MTMAMMICHTAIYHLTISKWIINAEIIVNIVEGTTATQLVQWEVLSVYDDDDDDGDDDDDDDDDTVARWKMKRVWVTRARWVPVEPN